MATPEHWAVDKRVPLPSIIAGGLFIIGQTWFLAWWMSSLSYRVTTVESRQTQFEDTVKALQPQTAEMAVMKEKITGIQATLNKLETIFFTPKLDGPPVTPAKPQGQR